MTSLRLVSEKENEEDVKFGIEIEQFYLQYHFKGEVYELTDDNLKDLFGIYILGIND